MQHQSEHAQQEIFNRIKADLARNSITASYLQFRLVFVSREGETLQKEILFISPVYERGGGAS